MSTRLSESDGGKLSNRPRDTAFLQQQLRSYPPSNPKLTLYAATLLALLGILFIPTGTTLLSQANAVFESVFVYDDNNEASLGDCHISTANQGAACTVVFTLDQDVTGPLYVLYELKNYYQNHRRYFKSRSELQLRGYSLSAVDVDLDCSPLLYNGSYLLNPCGLVANSFFNDVISLNSSSVSNAFLDESNIALSSDVDTMFKQVSGFQSVNVGSTPSSNTCDYYGLDSSCSRNYFNSVDGSYHYFSYPNEDTVQYLYESFPGIISPLDGVTDQHFIVWMRTASLPSFRKLYGVIGDENSVFINGDTFTFNIINNFEVAYFDGQKALVLTTLGSHGKNIFIGACFWIGGISLFSFAGLMTVKELFFL